MDKQVEEVVAAAKKEARKARAESLLWTFGECLAIGAGVSLAIYGGALIYEACGGKGNGSVAGFID